MSLNRTKIEWCDYTSNPVIGCEHDCIYCYGRRMAEWLKDKTPTYNEGYKPKLIESRLSDLDKIRNSSIFMVDMGDLFGEWVPDEWIYKVLDAVIRADRSNTFIFLTKNPIRYKDFIETFPSNCVLGVTIETDSYDYQMNAQYITKAPSPFERYVAMSEIKWPYKFVSIEPIMEFDEFSFGPRIKQIGPRWVVIGADSKGNKLNEPLYMQIDRLIKYLSKYTRVMTKENLGRLGVYNWDCEPIKIGGD